MYEGQSGPIQGVLKANFLTSDNRDNVLCIDPEPTAAAVEAEGIWGPADEIPGTYQSLDICAPWHGLEDIVYHEGSPPPEVAMIRDQLLATCQAECEVLPFEEIFPATISDSSGTWDFHHVECYFGSIVGWQNNPWATAPGYDPQCGRLDGSYNPLNPPFIPNVTHTDPFLECGICESLSCGSYDPTEHASHVNVSGRAEASLDWTWAAEMMQSMDVWICDFGRLQFRIDPAGDEEFTGLGPGGLWYELGFRSGDKNPKAWEFNPVTKARVGQEYPIDTPENAAEAWAALGGETHVAFTVTRAGRSFKVYITKYFT